MVDGVHGNPDHAVKVVVVEHKDLPEDVIILHLPVEEIIVLVQISGRLHATTSVVQVGI